MANETVNEGNHFVPKGAWKAEGKNLLRLKPMDLRNPRYLNLPPGILAGAILRQSEGF